MAQVVATRSIQSSFPCPSSGPVQERVDKLKPCSFSAKVLGDEGKKSCKSISFKRFQITAKRSVQAEVVPVSPEDVPKVFTFSVLFLDDFKLLRKLLKIVNHVLLKCFFGSKKYRFVVQNV